MQIHIHSVAGGTCLVDFERDGFARGEDPAGFTALLSVEAARELSFSETGTLDLGGVEIPA